MRASVISVTERVRQRFAHDDVDAYLDAFNLDCTLRNHTQKTIDVYFERLGYLFAYLGRANVGFEDVDKRLIQDYILSLKGEVSDEVINKPVFC